MCDDFDTDPVRKTLSRSFMNEMSSTKMKSIQTTNGGLINPHPRVISLFEGE